MRNEISFKYLIFCCGLVIAASTSIANPIQPIPALEIQVIDSLHWTIEVDCQGDMGFHINFPTVPCSTDTVTFYSSPKSTVPAESLRICEVPEQVNANKLILLTPQHFPNLKIKKGWTFFLGLKGRPYIVWQTTISQDIPRDASLITSVRSYDCGDIIGSTILPMTCREVVYSLSPCPSIGAKNSNAFGSIAGTLRGKNGISLSRIRVSCNASPRQNAISSITNSDGTFRINNLDSCHTYSLWFSDSNQIKISDTLVGPLHVSVGKTRTVDVNLDYSPPPTALSPQQTQKASTDNSARMLLSPTGRKIVLTISGNPSTEQGKIDIFSINGSMVRSLAFTCMGAGTYTIPWDGCNEKNRQIPCGTYICRVKIGDEVQCKGIVTK